MDPQAQPPVIFFAMVNDPFSQAWAGF
jgi:hypothetical protein